MSGDINSLGHQLNRFSERNRHFRDFTLYSLISTLKEVIACFPVYRTYITPRRGSGQRSRSPLHRRGDALREAPRAGVTPLVFDFIERLLLQGATRATARGTASSAQRSSASSSRSPARSPPKGIEDTAFYVYNRLLSLNEVGRRPDALRHRPGSRAPVAGRRQQRLARTRSRRPSTHDTKRGEDVRARLNVLSEMPGEWKAAVARLARAEPALQDRRRRRIGARRQRGVLPLPDAGRRLAVRLPRRGRGARFVERIARVHDQGAARGEGPHELAEPGRGVRARGHSGSSRRSSIAGAVRFCRRFARSRRASPNSASTTAWPSCCIKITAPGRAGLLPGHRILGSEPGRSRQSPAGRLRASAGARSTRSTRLRGQLGDEGPRPTARSARRRPRSSCS